jgi:insulysin
MAEDARMSTVFSASPYHLDIILSGFSDKIPILLQEVLTGMATLPPKEEQFALSVSRVQKKYENSTKDLPAIQANALLSAMVHPEQIDASKALQELSSISLEEFTTFYYKLLETTYCEGLFAGNIALKTAESAWLDVLHSLGGSPYPKAEHPQLRALHISEDEGPFLLKKSTQAQGYGAALLVDLGDFSFESKAAQTVLASAIQEPFFDTLRTKQKTGYIARTTPSEVEKRLYQTFLVQSNTHEPDDLLSRFELFLEELCEDFTNIVSEERFTKILQNSIATLKTQYRNIGMKGTLWRALAFEEGGDFAFVDKKIAALEALSYEDFVTTSRQWLGRQNRKRVAALCRGKIENPYRYTPITKDEFITQANYVPRPIPALQEAAQNE